MNLNQEFNLHSHTTRCGHANGADEEYVLAAIKAGFQEMGFSDHIFLPGLTQPRMRGNYELLDDYLGSVTSLQKKYQNQIKIYKAFEAEWYGPRFEDYYKELLSKGIVDYLILGQHCFFDKQFIFYGRYENRSLGTYLYLNDLLKGMESGLFLYVCHPDLFMAWHGIFDTQAYEAAKAIANLDARSRYVKPGNLFVTITNNGQASASNVQVEVLENAEQFPLLSSGVLPYSRLLGGHSFELRYMVFDQSPSMVRVRVQWNDSAESNKSQIFDLQAK